MEKMNTEQKTSFQIAEAYWISPMGEIYPVKQLHINFMRDNLELFEINEETYRNTFIKYKEKFGFEGKARAELMKNAISNGWIRIRFNGNSGWTIEVRKLDLKNQSYINNWKSKIQLILDYDSNVNLSENTPIEIHELEK